jgi:hypothetical protein
MRTETLYISYPADSAYPETLELKTERTLSFLGEQFRFRIIGSSHFITAWALGFAELVSCEPPDADPAAEVPLTLGYQDTVSTRVGGTAVRTAVHCLPLDAFPRDVPSTLQYRFAEDAYTTITLDRPAGQYTTYHTYPEHDIAVHTRSRLTDLSAQADGLQQDTQRGTVPTGGGEWP